VHNHRIDRASDIIHGAVADDIDASGLGVDLNGLLTIARGTLPLAMFGAAGYGLRTGILAAPARILQGGAPLLFGLVLDRAGP
jgi:hypothetical protein